MGDWVALVASLLFASLPSMETDEQGNRSEYQEGSSNPRCVPVTRDHGAPSGQMTCDADG
jgi:hypothetical protein